MLPLVQGSDGKPFELGRDRTKRKSLPVQFRHDGNDRRVELAGRFLVDRGGTGELIPGPQGPWYSTSYPKCQHSRFLGPCGFCLRRLGRWFHWLPARIEPSPHVVRDVENSSVGNLLT